MKIILSALIVVFFFAFMEFFAWFTHKYVMHGFLWVLHEDHHRKSGKLEKNDLFTLMFATPAVLLLVFGIHNSNWVMISAGAGITLYGIGYFLFHDVMFHKRTKNLFRLEPFTPYLKHIVNAHKIHHQKGGTNGEDSVMFGFLWAPKKLPEV